MNWHEYSNLEGKHAYLSPSQYSWIRYTEEKLIDHHFSMLAKEEGTELHEWAAKTIKLNRKQIRNKDTVNMFINDAIGFKMVPEKLLYYSHYCFGTADAISFEKNFLRIHDLKTGKIPASMDQLYIYAALFCLEYKYKPCDIKIETRIYQNGEIFIATPEADVIVPIMDKIITFSKILEKIDSKEGI